jgi:hypothetical protein
MPDYAEPWKSFVVESRKVYHWRHGNGKLIIVKEWT